MRYISKVLILFLLFWESGVCAFEYPEYSPRLIEIFTTSENQLLGTPSQQIVPIHPDIELQQYLLDGIQRVEVYLSHDLSTELRQATQVALRRIQLLDAKAMEALQQTAIGLAKAMQYGLDRYPAIVFDNKAVVFGMTDLESALETYRRWLSESQP